MRKMFEVKTENTFEEYKDFFRVAIAASRAIETKAFKTKRAVRFTLLEIATIAYIIFLIWMYFKTKESWALVMIAIMAVVEIYYVFRVVNYLKLFRTSKDEKFMHDLWENSVKMRGHTYLLTFENEYFTVLSQEFSANIKYELVNRLIETKTHFYIMTGINQGFIARKDALTKDQCLFIRTHCSSEEKPQIIV